MRTLKSSLSLFVLSLTVISPQIGQALTLEQECLAKERCCSDFGGEFFPLREQPGGIKSCSCRGARPADEYRVCVDAERARLAESGGTIIRRDKVMSDPVTGRSQGER